MASKTPIKSWGTIPGLTFAPKPSSRIITPECATTRSRIGSLLPRSRETNSAHLPDTSEFPRPDDVPELHFAPVSRRVTSVKVHSRRLWSPSSTRGRSCFPLGSALSRLSPGPGRSSGSLRSLWDRLKKSYDYQPNHNKRRQYFSCWCQKTTQALRKHFN